MLDTIETSAMTARISIEQDWSADTDQMARLSWLAVEVVNQPFEIDRFQDMLFVADSFDQLSAAVDEAGWRIGA